jgi:hypothetical protein
MLVTDKLSGHWGFLLVPCGHCRFSQFSGSPLSSFLAVFSHCSLSRALLVRLMNHIYYSSILREGEPCLKQPFFLKILVALPELHFLFSQPLHLLAHLLHLPGQIALGRLSFHRADGALVEGSRQVWMRWPSAGTCPQL